MIIDEAIKHAEEVAERKCYLADMYHSNEEYLKEEMKFRMCAEEHRQLAEWLKELKRLKEQTRWIPVSKRLPDKSDNYWCTFGGGNLTGKDYYITELDAKKIFDEPEEYVGWGSQNVIAWMPLPQPYKEESEE